MKKFYSLYEFAWDKFREEDGDGINLVLMDPKRKSHRDLAEYILKEYIPAMVDQKGTIHYYLADLEEVWDKSKFVC